MSHLIAIRSAFQTKLNLERDAKLSVMCRMSPGEIRAANIYAHAHGQPDLAAAAQMEAAAAALDAAIDAARRARLTTPMQIQADLRRAGIVVVDGVPALRNPTRVSRADTGGGSTH